MSSRRAAPALLVLAAAIAAPLPAAGAAAPAYVPPAPDRYVTDTVGVLDRDRAAALERKLADFERDTSTQVPEQTGSLDHVEQEARVDVT